MVYTSCKICNNEIRPFIESKGIVQCTHCRLVFYYKSLEDESLAEIYKTLYNNGNDPSYAAHINDQELILKGIQPKLGYNKRQILKRVLQSGKSEIAEIGAGVGVVGKYLSDRKKNYTGIELEQSVAQIAKDAGLNIEAGSYKALHKYPGTFDIILAFEVIEHIDELALCLKLLNHSLKQKGLFGFTVPNLKKRDNYADVGERLYQPNPPIHLNFFTEENIPRILKTFGFRIVFLETRSFPVLNFNKLHTYTNLLKALLGKFQGSTIFCIAEKY